MKISDYDLIAIDPKDRLPVGSFNPVIIRHRGPIAMDNMTVREGLYLKEDKIFKTEYHYLKPEEIICWYEIP